MHIESLKKKISVSIFVIFLALGITSPLLAAPQMVAYWPLDDGEGTLVTDIVSGNNGTMVGLDPATAWISDGKFSTAVRFDGVNDHHIEVPHSEAIEFGDEDFSISCWIRYPDRGVAFAVANQMNGWVVKGTNAAPGTGNRYQLYVDNGGGVRLDIDNDAVGRSRLEVDNASFFTGDWVHVVAVRDSINDLLSLYADGILQGTATESSGDISNGEPLRIGNCVSEQAPMIGDIDDVIIFAQALTENEILEVYGFFQPADGAIEVARDVVFKWTQSESISAFDVYLGTVFDDVNDASRTNPLDVLAAQGLESTTFTPDDLLEYGQTYYWRVDKIGAPTESEVIKGDVLSFTVLNYLVVVDDFEDYNDFSPNEIWNTWIDGYGDPTNGSSAGYPEPDFIAGEHYVETRIVRSGEQSMPLFYDNSVGLSEATKALNADWTQGGVVTLTLFYRGDTSNGVVPMYVVINGNNVVTNPEANAVLATEWTKWDIPLQTFVDMGVNLANVGSMSIGLGNKANPVAGGSGVVYIDDIRLYLPEPQ